jgi:hypothetical protein
MFFYTIIHLSLITQKFVNPKRIPKSLDLNNVIPFSEYRNYDNSQLAARQWHILFRPIVS